MGVLASVAQAYGSAVAQRPLVTNATLGCVIASVGDVLCQRYMEEREEINWRRTAEMGVIRALVMAPFLHVYFPLLAKTVPGTSMPRVLARVGLDQVLGSPISISLIFGAAAVLQGRVDTLPTRLEEQMPATWRAGASYWPFVHAVNFRLVPVPHQALVAHVASVWWNAVLSYRANLGVQGEGARGAVGGTEEGHGSGTAAERPSSAVVPVAASGSPVR